MANEQPMGDERIYRIVKSLINRSNLGRVEWEIARMPRSSSQDGFSTSTQSATIVIGSMDGDGLSPYYLDVIDSTGIRVERVIIPSDESSRRWSEDPDLSILELEAIKDLYTIARRQGLNIDHVLNTLADELEEE